MAASCSASPLLATEESSVRCCSRSAQKRHPNYWKELFAIVNICDSIHTYSNPGHLTQQLFHQLAKTLDIPVLVKVIPSYNRIDYVLGMWQWLQGEVGPTGV